jgi:CubicO group peptidase (beta-lactamase class C family)
MLYGGILMIKFETPFSPCDVGYNGERLSVLNNHFNKMIKENEIQAANYCLSRDGKVFSNTAIGKLSYKESDDRPLKPDTIQGIASITKMFCTVAIFKLVEDGKMRLDQTVGEFIDEFQAPPFNKINVAHLLSHTSGLHPDQGCFENKYFISPWDFIENIKDVSWIQAALSVGMRKEPGEEWAYCSFGFIILGEIISRVSGVFAHDYIMENIIKPCEMNDTGFEVSIEVAKRYIVRNERKEKFINSIIAGEKMDEGIWAKIPSTGGGLYSTALDLCKFGTMFINNGTYNGKRILGRKAIEKMTTLYTTPEIKDYCWNAGGVSRQYGLGPDMRNNLASFYSKGTFFHEGAGACCLIMDPIEKLIAAWFVPFTGDNWFAHGLYNVSTIIWSGLV